MQQRRLEDEVAEVSRRWQQRYLQQDVYQCTGQACMQHAYPHDLPQDVGYPIL